jgi:diaminopimelate decarboxylase
MTALPFHLLPDTSSVGADGRLSVGGCDLIDLAAEFGTPLFVYDEDHLRARCREAKQAFGEGAVYATKAFMCLAMARLAHEEGLLLDVATGGEMFVARQAGVPGARLVLHGNNKSMDELRLAQRESVGRVVVDSFDELDRIDALHAETGWTPTVLLRLTPGVEAHTHEYVATGHDDTKFGFTMSSGLAREAVERALASDAMKMVGVHVHIGSQVFRAESFAWALEAVAGFANQYQLSELSMGGGLGVAYVEGEQAPTISEWSVTLKEAAAEAGVSARLFAEPGRAIVASAALTLYMVGTIKELPGIRTYVAVDGGMSDNPRPVLYGSGYETFLPRSVSAARTRTVRVVGKHCESGDLLVLEGRVPADLQVGDILATPVTGAYGHSMGSNYNKVPRPAVIFVSQGNARLVVRRQPYEDMVRLDL